MQLCIKIYSHCNLIFLPVLKKLINTFLFLDYFQTQALALTRPKSPKKERSHSPSPPAASLLKNDHLRSPSERPSSPKLPAPNAPPTPITPFCERPPSNLNASNLITNSKIASSQSSLADNLSTSNNNNDSNMNSNHSISNHNSHHSTPIPNGPEKVLPSPSMDRKEFDFSKVNGEYSLRILSTY